MKPVRLKESEIKIKLPDETKELSHSVIAAEPNADTESFKIEKSNSLLLLSSLLIGLVAGLQIFESLASAFLISPWLGWPLSLATVGILGFLGSKILKELGKVRLQRRYDKLKARLEKVNSASSHGSALPIIKELQAQRFSLAEQNYQGFITRSQVCQDDSEIIHLYSKDVLYQKDNAAKEVVIKHSSDCALMVAVSPFAAIDMMLVVWRNFKMLNEIGQVYGIPNSPFSRAKVFKQVLKNMMLVGAQELVMDATFESMGVSLGTKLSARAAQGVGAGLISLRIGLKAIEYCRPISFSSDEVPKISNMRGEILSQVKSRLLNIDKH